MANSPYRPEFEAALRLFARVSEAMVARGLSRPILVGGAAVEYYSGSAVTTGDFDICSPWQDALDEELQRAGFVRPSGAGQLVRGWLHPALKLGFEIVASVPMDGNIDRDHVLLVEDTGDGSSFAIISVEDLIADRVGMRITRDEITTPGYVKFYVRKRVGGKIRNSQAIKVLKIAAA